MIRLGLPKVMVGSVSYQYHFSYLGFAAMLDYYGEPLLNTSVTLSSFSKAECFELCQHGFERRAQ